MNATPSTLPLARLVPGDNPRRHFAPAAHDELVASIRRRGLLQPLLVRPLDGGETWQIVAGHRRHRAAAEALGPEAEVPVVVRDLDDSEAIAAAIDENDVRDDTSETEQADAAARVLAVCAGDRAEAARRLGWSDRKLDRRLALSGLTDAVKTALDQRRIKVGHAELLAAVPGEKQDTALATIEANALTVATTRELLMRMTQRLAEAAFDKAECATCQFNSARQRALFETCVDDGHCTNAPCFELKSEAAEQARAEAEAARAPAATEPDSGAAGGEAGRGASLIPGESHPSTPDSSPGSAMAQGNATPEKTTASAAKKGAVTARSIAARAADHRETLWRQALETALTEDQPTDPRTIAAVCGILRVAARDRLAFDHVSRLAAALAVDLSESWTVDEAFLARFNKDELKFIARECGLVDHLGEKAFGKILRAPTHEVVAGMLHVAGFDWAGRLPSAVTLDGKPVLPEPAAPRTTETET